MNDSQQINVQTPVHIPEGTPWLNLDEAAEYIRQSKRKIESLIETRAVPSYRTGNRTLLKKQELDQFIEKGRRE